MIPFYLPTVCWAVAWQFYIIVVFGLNGNHHDLGLFCLSSTPPLLCRAPQYDQQIILQISYLGAQLVANHNKVKMGLNNNGGSSTVHVDENPSKWLRFAHNGIAQNQGIEVAVGKGTQCIGRRVDDGLAA